MSFKVSSFRLLAALLMLFLLMESVTAKRSRYTSGRKGGKPKTAKLNKDGSEGSDGTPDLDRDSLDIVAQYLHKGGGKAFKKYKYAEIRRALAKLASSQSALKTMDGATHHFVNAFKEASTLASRYDRFISAETPKKKEAAKLYEYVTMVERSLQAAEICQDVRNCDDPQRSAWLQEAGLVELKRVTIESNKLACVVSVLSPVASNASASNLDPEIQQGDKGRTQAFLRGEIVLCIVETGDADASINQALRVMSAEGKVVPLKSVGFVEEEITLQPTIMDLAAQALELVQEFIIAPPAAESPLPSAEQISTGLSSRQLDAQQDASLAVKSNTSNAVAPSIRQLPMHVRLVGYSAGAAVAAYMAMILDGSLISQHKLLKETSKFSKQYHKKVKCYCLAPPPCISRSIVPKFVYSMLCGDDLVPRASPDSIARLKERVLKALESGAGKGGLAAYGLGGLTSWMGDVSSVASKSLKQYAGGQHDLSALSVPGRVFYCKSRSLQNGASIQRVMRGNWKEDVLWLLHEVLVSKKMSEHHSLEYCIKTLSRL